MGNYNELEAVVLKMKRANRVNYLKFGAILILISIAVGGILVMASEIPRVVREAMGVPYEK